MQRDVLLLIGLEIRICDLVNFSIANWNINLVSEHFWNLRLKKDYNKSQGLALYKKYYQFKTTPHQNYISH
jgi:hypothetical protein